MAGAGCVCVSNKAAQSIRDQAGPPHAHSPLGHVEENRVATLMLLSLLLLLLHSFAHLMTAKRSLCANNSKAECSAGSC